MVSSLWARFKGLFSRFPWLTSALAWLTFAAGTVWRWFHVTRLHDPRDYVNSDMALYVGLAKRLAKPGYKLSIADITHPPGAATVFSWLYAHDDTMWTMTLFQFAVCALVPLAVAGLGWIAFDKGTAKLALVMTSLYFPFVDYGGYFLAEIHMTLTIPLSLLLFLWAAKQPKIWRVGAIGLLAGFVFSLSMALKALAFPAVACFLFIYFVFSAGPSRKTRAVAILALALGAIPVNKWQISRCTEANDGRFCLGSNKTASDFLLGHYGRIQAMTWRDPKGRGTFTFGSPSAYQHGYTDRPEVNFSMTDNTKNFAAAIGWIKKNPGQATLLSVEHVYDSFFGALPWPSIATKFWPGAAAFHYIFSVFIFFPAAMALVDILRRRGVKALLQSNELLVLAPVVGLIASVAIATGEPRYRIPFDSLFILVAIQFYRRWRQHKDPAAALALAGGGAANVPASGEPAAEPVLAGPASAAEAAPAAAPPVEPEPPAAPGRAAEPERGSAPPAVEAPRASQPPAGEA